MKMKQIEGSSQVHAHGYDPQSQTLHVHFHGRPASKDRKTGEMRPAKPAQHYSYANISAAQAEDFDRAHSKGAWVHAHLHPNPKTHPFTHHGDVSADQPADA